nr:MAG TPA: hypothetical protein [Caudoviricetes sp.]
MRDFKLFYNLDIQNGTVLENLWNRFEDISSNRGFLTMEKFNMDINNSLGYYRMKFEGFS